MGLFQNETRKNLAEVFPPGTPFRLNQAWIVGVEKSENGGMRTKAHVVVSVVEAPESQMEFGVWGSLAEQIRGVEAGELPLIVTLDNSTGVWTFAPHGDRGEGVVSELDGTSNNVPLNAVPEMHLDLEAGESDSPTPVPPSAAPAGTALDESHAEAAPELPPAQPARDRPLDESQVFDPRGDNPTPER